MINLFRESYFIFFKRMRILHMNNSDTEKSFLNFELTLEAYDAIMDYIEDNNLLNEDNAESFSIYESLMFELAIAEVTKLKQVLIQENAKYLLALLEVKKAKAMIDDLIKEITKMAEKEKLEKERKEQEQNDTVKSTKESFIDTLKGKFSKFFNL